MDEDIRNPEDILARMNAGGGGGGAAPSSSSQEREDGAGPIVSFYRSIPRVLSKTTKAVTQGAKRAVNQFGDTLQEITEPVVEAQAEQVQRFTERVEEKHGESNPSLTALAESYEKALEREGFRFNVPEERMEGAYGFVESIAQFTTGMVAFGRLGGIRTMGPVVKGMVTGALTDISAVDPYEERVSNLIQEGPEWLRNPLTEYLQADEDDSATEARLKAALEGLITGGMIDSFVWAAKVVRATRMARAGKITTEEAQAVAAEALEKAAETRHAPGDIVEVVHTPGEPSVVRPVSPYPSSSSARKLPEPLTFDNPAVAEAVGASMNDAHKAANRPRNTLTDDTREAWKTILARIKSGVDPNDKEALLEGIQLNFSRVAEPEDVKAVVNALAEAEPDFPTLLANRRADGLGQGWDETKRLAAEILPEFEDPDAALARFQQVFEDTKNLPQVVYAMRVYFWGTAKEVEKLARKADMVPDDPIVYQELSDAVDSLYGLQGWLAGTKATAGRWLDSLKIPVEGELPAGRLRPNDPAPAPGRGVDEATPQTTPRNVEEPTPAPREGEAGQPSTPSRVRTTDPGTPQTPSGPAQLPSNAKRVVQEREWKPSKDLSPSELRALARAITFSDGDPTRIMNALRGTVEVKNAPRDEKTWQKWLGFRANMMLSGPVTQMTNAVANAINAFQVPAEYWYAGVRTNNPELRQQGWDMLTSMWMEQGDAFRAAIKAWKVGDNILDPQNMQLEHSEYIYEGMSWLAKLANVPSRALMASDEFFKQVSYRAHVRSQSLRHSREVGITDPQEIARRVVEDLEWSFDRHGGAVNPLALSHSRYITHTQSLEPGTIGHKLQQAANEHPIVRIVFPFVRTPVNILRFTAHRTPGLNRFTRQWKEDIAAGGERAAIAKARSEVGGALWSMAAALAYQGTIVGGGPKNPTLRSQWLEAGNEPYTFRIGGKQISYRRMEPLATPLAVAADAFEMLGELSSEDADTVMYAAIAGMMSSVTSKTFLTGLSEVLDAASSGDERLVRRMLNSVLLSFTPNLMRQINQDPVWRETRGIIEELQARTPGWSENLEPRRNIFGEPVVKAPPFFQKSWNPFSVMDAPDDEDVAIQLVELGRAMDMPSPTRAGGRIDLQDRERWVREDGKYQSPYDRMLEIVANPPGRMPPLREAMETLVKSPGWQNASAGTDLYPGGLKHRMAQDLLTQYYQVAEQVMLSEYPELRAELMNERVRSVEALFLGQ